MSTMDAVLGGDGDGGDTLGFFQELFRAFRNVNPYTFGSLGLACCIGPSVLGAAWYERNQARRASGDKNQ